MLFQSKKDPGNSRVQAIFGYRKIERKIGNPLCLRTLILCPFYFSNEKDGGYCCSRGIE